MVAHWNGTALVLFAPDLVEVVVEASNLQFCKVGSIVCCPLADVTLCK